MFLLFICISYGWQLREGLIHLLIVCSGDIEVNLRPKIKSQLSLWYWNLNGLAAYNFIKVSLLQTLAVARNYDSLLVTFLDQGFIHTILMSVIRNKKLSLTIEFWNSIFIYIFYLFIYLFLFLSFSFLFCLIIKLLEFICSSVSAFEFQLYSHWQNLKSIIYLGSASAVFLLK